MHDQFGIRRRLIALSILVISLQAVAQPRAGDVSIEPATIEIAGKKVEAERGRLYVPENRASGDGKLISLAFVRFKSTSSNPGPPIVYLAGGPGGSGIATARSIRFVMFEAMRAAGDVIALDQRGVGESEPNLRYDKPWDFPLERPIDPAEAGRHAADRARECVEHFQAQGIDLGAYTTEASADDIDDLRRALGAEKIALWGTSYGTHLGLAVIRRHGAHVARAALFGAEGPDHSLKLPSQIDAGLKALSDVCAADPDSRDAVPDLAALAREVIDRVEREPASAEIFDSRDQKNAQVAVGKFEVQLWAANAIGRAGTARLVPSVFLAMSQGDFRYVARATFEFKRDQIGSAMALAMDCASNVSPERLARIRAEEGGSILGSAVNFPFMEVCAGSGLPVLGAEFRGPLRSDVPVLFVSGTLDSRTPPGNAEELMKGLPRSEHLIIENAGHEESLFSASPEMRAAVADWMQGKPLAAARLRVDPPNFGKIPVPAKQAP